jgi:D-galactose 1-dehydrogenase
MTLKIGLVGVGKIAKYQHAPAIRANPAYELIATASRHGVIEGVKSYPTIEELIAGEPELEAVGLCMPPQPRFAAAQTALKAGKHVLLEKPPGATLSEVEILSGLARDARVTLFATWHSRFSPGVEKARAWLLPRAIRSVQIDWREDVRHWHPGQAWIWEPGGLGVFDPGINALSIATRILPKPFFLKSGTLDFPANRATPIAAELKFEDADGIPIGMGLDWLQTGPQTWDVRVETDDGVLLLQKGGSVLVIDGKTLVDEPEAEYPGLYRRFAELVAARASEVDVSPLRHVADAFLNGLRRQVAAYVE